MRVILIEGDLLTVEIESEEIVISYGASQAQHLTISTTAPDSTQRMGVIYDEDYNYSRPLGEE